MNNLMISSSRFRYWEIVKILIFILALGFFWSILQHTNWSQDVTMGYIDPSIWLLILIGVLCFVMMVALSAWICMRLWNAIGLPAPQKIISQFNYLESCQKIKFLFAAYALLLLAGVGCLVAIC